MAGEAQQSPMEGPAPEALAVGPEQDAPFDRLTASGAERQDEGPADFSPDRVLADALQRGAQVAVKERAAQPVLVVLQRAHGELGDGGLTDPTHRLLQTALSAANHNEQLSPATRTALAAVAVALRGLN